jgi:hypothetical protein
MQRLLEQGWNCHKVLQINAGSGEMAVLYPPWTLSYCP